VFPGHRLIQTPTRRCALAPLRGTAFPPPGRWVKLERERRQAVREGRPDPREMEAEITALRRRVRELEKENEFLGKASAFFASRHQNTSALN